MSENLIQKALAAETKRLSWFEKCPAEVQAFLMKSVHKPYHAAAVKPSVSVLQRVVSEEIIERFGADYLVVGREQFSRWLKSKST